MKLYYPAILFIMIFQICSSQDENASYRHLFNIDGQYGFIIPHADEVEPLSGYNPAGLNFSYHRMNTTYDSWSVFNTFWSGGLRISYFDFGNRRELGGTFLSTFFVEPVLSYSEKYVFSIGGGAGFSYHTKRYDAVENPKNQFFSTAISFPLFVYSRLSFRIAGNYNLFITATYNHISNGGIRQPNFGMNFPTVGAGIGYLSDGIPSMYISRNIVEQRLSYTIQALTSYKVVDASALYPERGFFASGVHARISRQLTGHYGLNAGGELIFDNAIRETIKRSGSMTDYKRAAITAGQDFIFGKTSFTQYFGFYVYSPYKARNSVYQKYELSYKFHPAFGAGVFLKAHLYIAELMGIQLFYTGFFSKQ